MNTRTHSKAPRFRKSDFKARRTELASLLEPRSAAIFVSNPEQTRSNDTEFPYRQSSNMLYLSNFPEPESILVVTNLPGYPKSILFVRPKDKASEQWTGIREGVDGAIRNYGVSKAYPIDEFEEVLGEILRRADNVYYTHRVNEQLDSSFDSVWLDNPVTLRSAQTLASSMRLIKSEREVDVMRYAAEVTAEAHAEAMRLCEPGMQEYQLQATLEAVFAFNGLRYPSYTSIVGGGANATVLHYVTNDDELRDRDLVLIDAGGEYQGYAADITRTFPVNGKFTKAQLEIYNLVLAAQEAAIRAARPGKTMHQLHLIAQNRLRRGLVELGILPSTMLTKADHSRAVRKAKGKGELGKLSHLGRYFMHGTGHWLGIDVHDAPWERASRMQPLEPGMVFTVEPGLYFEANDKLVPRKYRGIGIRIEDDVVITEDGCEVLTSGVPKKADEIESLMAEGLSGRLKMAISARSTD